MAYLLELYSGIVCCFVFAILNLEIACSSSENLDLRSLLEREGRSTGTYYADADSFNNTRMTPTTSSTADEGVDFIIARGGTAGLVLANRLTADPDVSVLVGSDRLEDSKIKTPGLVATLYNGPSHDWSFETVPQVCDKSIYLPSPLLS